MATKFFCARRTKKQQKKMAFELLSCARRIRKALTNVKRPSSIFSSIRLVVNKSCSPFLLHRHVWQFECESEKVLKFFLRSKSTDRSKPFLAIQCNLDLHFCMILCWWRILFINLNYVRGKCCFLKEGDKIALNAIDSSLKNRWSLK